MSVSDPQVTFVIPAFNAAKTLPATLDSLAAQTFADWEAVVVDDGSKDQTAAVASARARLDRRVRVIRQANGGASAARNRGIAEARGGLVGFLDADDWISPEFLTEMVPLAAGGRAVSYCAYRRILPSGRASPVDWCPELETDPFGVLAERCEPAIHCMLIPAHVLSSVGGFDETLRTCEDWDLWLRIARTGIAFRGTCSALASYRMRAYSLSTGRAVSDDAGRVFAIARTCDPRVEKPDASYAQGWQTESGKTLTRVLARECAQICQAGLPTSDWIVSALGGNWRSVVLADPADIIDAIYAAARATPQPVRVARTFMASIEKLDSWVGALLSDWHDMGEAEGSGSGHSFRSGRWLGVHVDPARLPHTIDPPAGCDALLLVCTSPEGHKRRVALAMTGPVAQARLARALLDLWSLPELMSMTRYRRSPRFAWALVREGAVIAARHRTLVLKPSRWRAFAGTVTRRALARTLRAPLGAPPTFGEAAVLMFDRIVPGIAGVLDTAIGSTQVADLLTLLAAEGFTTITLADLAEARRGAGTLPPRPLVLVFADAGAALASGVLACMPEGFRTIEMLYEPEDIEQGLPSRVIEAAAHLHVSGGLRIRRLPLATGEAIEKVAHWRAALARQLAGRRPVGALCDLQGLPVSILQEAGFELILNPGAATVRLDLPSPIIPALECCGSGGIGDVLENLRPAA